eukprot:GHRQ01027378.1.p3 GENE.GHRQ01027378.1~~GHRQ01027378.1.p3  ORF type:complete len:106 (+),score=34.91 GHRQ01027378.1:44-361(+)
MAGYCIAAARLLLLAAACTAPLQLKLEIRPRARAAVSKVLLVGGATRIPAVQRFITNMTGLTPVGADGGVDPDEAVALGAAVQVRPAFRYVVISGTTLYACKAVS